MAKRVSLTDTIIRKSTTTQPPRANPEPAVADKPVVVTRTDPAVVHRSVAVEVRKEAFLRPEVITELDQLARALQRSARKGERRITANTLLRVAADLLLEEKAYLRGSTEAELLASLRRADSTVSVTTDIQTL